MEVEAVPDHLRCRRSDGRQWRCNQRVVDNKSLCERHLARGRNRKFKQKLRKVSSDNLLCSKINGRKWRGGRRVVSGGKHSDFQFLRACQQLCKGKVGEALPDHLRCNRTDGKEWRCRRRVMEGKKLCELHHLQGLHRQHRHKVPDSLKLQRKRNLEVRAHKIEKSSKVVGAASMGLIGFSEVLDEALRRMKLKKGDLELELIRMVLKREVEKTKRRDLEESSEGEMTRNLPNGLMAISPALSSMHFGNVGSNCNVKVGDKSGAMARRCFRSKNIEPLPVATLQVLPGMRNVANLRRVQRHFGTCEKVNMACPVCHGTCSCKTSMASQPKDAAVSEEFTREKKKVEKILDFHYLICMLLPVLKEINKHQSVEVDMEATTEGDFRQSEKKLAGYSKKNRCSAYFATPSAKPNDPNASNCNGRKSCPPTDSGACGDTFLNLKSVFPLSWTKELEISAEEIICSYEIPETSEVSSCCTLCLDTSHNVHRIKNLQEAASREDSNDNLLYHPTVLESHCDNLEHFQKHWGRGHPVIVRNVFHKTSKVCWDPVFMLSAYLEGTSAKSDVDKEVRKASNCLDWFEIEISIGQLFLGSQRGQTHTNMWQKMLKLMGCLSSHLLQEQFPAHYAVIIDALPFQEYMNPNSGLLNLAALLPAETPKPDIGPCVKISYGNTKELAADNFVTKLSYNSYDMVNILAHATDVPISPEQLTRIRNLMDKHKGQDENDSTKITTVQDMQNNAKQQSSLKSGNTEEAINQNAIGEEMHMNKRVADVSQCPVTMHEAYATSLDEQNLSLRREEDSDPDASVLSCSQSLETSKNHGHCEDRMEDSSCFQERILAESCGAQWDVFRRQDVPKLIEYLRRHSDELIQTDGLQKHVVHPILDRSFFLDATHKMRLKEEFKIEPWTFEQHVGEAVIIPAGCPYQIRNFKSCVNVVLDFVSPENATECIHLTDELQTLPEGHKAKVDKLEVRKMALYGISAATKEIRDITCAKHTVTQEELGSDQEITRHIVTEGDLGSDQEITRHTVMGGELDGDEEITRDILMEGELGGEEVGGSRVCKRKGRVPGKLKDYQLY